MKHITKFAAAAAVTLAFATGGASLAAAEVIEVKMLNFNPDDPSQVMVFEPQVVRANPGDTIRFVSVDAFHNSKSIEGMIPDGAEAWESPISENFEVVVNEEGTYGYLCVPHQLMGMAGLILVGDYTKNLDAVKALQHDGMLQLRFDALFAELQ
ncbi:MAG: pseudoazurin [Pseudomonadota bacterium]